MPHIQAAPFSHMPLLVRGYAQLGDPEIRRITSFSGIFHGNAALLHAQIYILVRVFNEQWDFAFRLAVKPLNPDAIQIAAPAPNPPTSVLPAESVPLVTIQCS